MTELFTIGYEGADLNDFIETLKLIGVTVLLDIRELPISRRKGFAKNALRQALETELIQYRHEARLGSPKPIRDKLKRDKDYGAFFAGFDAHLHEQRELLISIAEELNGNIALMCYERNFRECHRFSVARELGELVGSEPRHVGVQGHEQRKAYKKAHPHLGKGVPTT